MCQTLPVESNENLSYSAPPTIHHCPQRSAASTHMYEALLHNYFFRLNHVAEMTASRNDVSNNLFFPAAIIRTLRKVA